jgi:hypothetical protein
MDKKTHWFKPYQENGRATLKKTGSGVYLIKNGDKIVYIGYSNGALKKTLYRHFQKWTDTRAQFLKDRDGFDRVSYYGWDISNFKVRVIFTNTATRAYNLETELIRRYRPEQNKSKLQSLFDEDQRKKDNLIDKKVEDDFFTEIDNFFNIPKFNPDEEVPF